MLKFFLQFVDVLIWFYVNFKNTKHSRYGIDIPSESQKKMNKKV